MKRQRKSINHRVICRLRSRHIADNQRCAEWATLSHLPQILASLPPPGFFSDSLFIDIYICIEMLMDSYYVDHWLNMNLKTSNQCSNHWLLSRRAMDATYLPQFFRFLLITPFTFSISFIPFFFSFGLIISFKFILCLVRHTLDWMVFLEKECSIWLPRKDMIRSWPSKTS